MPFGAGPQRMPQHPPTTTTPQPQPSPQAAEATAIAAATAARAQPDMMYQGGGMGGGGMGGGMGAFEDGHMMSPGLNVPVRVQERVRARVRGHARVHMCAHVETYSVCLSPMAALNCAQCSHRTQAGMAAAKQQPSFALPCAWSGSAGSLPAPSCGAIDHRPLCLPTLTPCRSRAPRKWWRGCATMTGGMRRLGMIYSQCSAGAQSDLLVLAACSGLSHLLQR